jgi:HemY protein
VSPVSGKLDSFEWKVPIAELADDREVIDADRPQPGAAPASVTPPAAPARAAESRAEPSPDTGASAPRPSAALPAARPAGAPRAEPVIPLLHVPDDPGPDPAPDQEPQPEPSDSARGLRLFK